MTGEYTHYLDAKGRLAIPAKLRDELGDVFYVTLSVDKCLHAYNLESWKKFTDKVDSMSYMDQRKMRPLYAYAARCELDSQGRVLVPQKLRDYVGLRKSVTVVGNNNHAEFWDSDEWKKTQEIEMTPENILAVMQEVDF